MDLVKEYVLDVREERKSRFYGEHACAQQPSPQSPIGDLGDIAGVKVRNCKGLCQGGKPGMGKLCTDVCLCSSAHTSVCVVDGLGATAAHLSIIIIGTVVVLRHHVHTFEITVFNFSLHPDLILTA